MLSKTDQTLIANLTKAIATLTAEVQKLIKQTQK